jgi:hypothetical protein
MDEEIEKYSKFLSLNELKLTSNDDEDDEDTEIPPSIIPIDTGSNASATTDILKRGRHTLSAPKGEASSHKRNILSFVGAQSNPAVFRAMMGDTISNSGRSSALPMSRMPIAASYEPFKGITDEILNENILAMKKRVNSLLNKEPHKSEVNKMRKELEM